MPATIPSLWPDDIKVDVLPPLTILKLQAAKLHGITKGILDAEVTTVTGPDDLVTHRLDLIAPTLDGRRTRVLVATQRTEFYPVVLEADCYRPKDSYPFGRSLAAISEVVAGMSAEWPRSNDWRPAANDQDEFLKRIAEVLRSPTVRSIIDSLLALSNEKNQPADTESAA